MKKSMLRIASVLLVAVMLTTCIISGAFAKYVTTRTNDAEVATVAKWGVTITENTGDGADNDLFDASYVWTGAQTKPDGVTASVNAVAAVVAPGTTGSLKPFEIKGTPDVAVEITYASTLTLTNFVEATYCPIVFNVAGTDYYIGKTAEINNIADLQTAVNNAIVAQKQIYGPNTNLDGEVDLAISWTWCFDQAAATTAGYTGLVINDAKDTALGDAATGDNVPTIEWALTATVTQID